VRTEGIVNVEYHQFSISGPDTETLDAQHEGTLIETGPGFVSAFTGITFGPVHVAIETLDSAPGDSDPTGWEVIEESAIESRENLLLTTAAGSVISSLTPIPPGRYHIRAYARGRDLNAGLEVHDPSEHYLFHLWPHEPDRIIDLAVREILETDTAWSEKPAEYSKKTARQPNAAIAPTWIDRNGEAASAPIPGELKELISDIGFAVTNAVKDGYQFDGPWMFRIIDDPEDGKCLESFCAATWTKPKRWHVAPH